MNNPLRSALFKADKPGTSGSGLVCNGTLGFFENPVFSFASRLAGCGWRPLWMGLLFVLLVSAGTSAAERDEAVRLASVTEEPVFFSRIPSQIIDEDTSTEVIPFGVSFKVSSLKSISGSSSNTNLVPNANISITLDAANWLLQVTPARDQFGTVVITLRAEDARGNVGQISFPLTVKPVDDPVTVRLVNPTDGQVFLAPGRIELIAEVSDPDHLVDRVEFVQTSNGKSVVLASLSSPPFLYIWSEVTPGDYGLETVAIDNKGVRIESAPVPVEVRNSLVGILDRVDVLEGNTGDSNAGRTIQIPITGLPSQSAEPETITYWTSDGTAEDARQGYAAIQGIDYRPILPTQIEIDANTLTTTLTVEILGDVLDERNKRFYLNWDSSNPNRLVARQLKVDIIDDDPPPSVSINDVQVQESWGVAEFTLSLSSPSLWRNPNEVQVQYAVFSGSAEAGQDFGATTNIITIPSEFSSATIRVPILNDTNDEPNETFFIEIKAIKSPENPGDVTVAKGRGQGIILDDDGPPEIFPLNAEVTEGERIRFNVALSLPSGFPIDVDYTTADGTALAGTDYEAQSGTLHFDPLQTNAIVRIPTLEDRLSEASETFFLRLSNPTNAVFRVPAPEATGTILDNEDPPVLTINTAAVLELDSGVTNALFTVTLSSASGQVVRVNYATADGTARAGEDYTATSGVLEFQSGETIKTFVVPVLGDTIIEKGELFFVNLTVVGNTATPTAVQGIGIIVDNEPFTKVSITDATLLEGDSGVVNAIFSVLLDEAIDRPVTVEWATANRTALALDDYLPDSGKITFEPGDVRKEIFIQILGDKLSEAPETFVVELSNPINAQINQGEGIGTIENDDPVPSLSLDGSFQPTAREGSLEAVIQLRLSEVSGQKITLDYTTREGTASAGSDYEGAAGQVSIPAGENSAFVRIPLIDDQIDEFDETFSVVFSNPVSVTAGFVESEIPLTILDDDEPPVLVFPEQRVSEGSSGVTSATVEVRLSGPSGKPITANYQTQNGTARSATDYRPTIDSVTFKPGVTNQSIPLEIIGDEIRETEEVFYLRFEEMTNLSPPALLLGAVTIGDDDTVPGISVAAVQHNEGTENLEQVTFVAMLTAPSEELISFEYTTEPGTALPFEDYFPGGGTVTIQPGASSASFSIFLNNDRLNELHEEFSVRFSPPRNALFEAGQDRAVARILNDDPEPTVTVRARSLLEGDEEGFAVVTVTLSEASGRTVTLDYATEDGTAIAGLDYRPAQGSITLPPGETERNFVIPILGDLVHEPSREELVIPVSNVNNAILGNPNAEARLTIVDDDDEPPVSIANAEVKEGDALVFLIRMAEPAAQDVSVQFSTADGTAVSTSDFEARQETVILPKGETEHAVVVVVRNDTIPEPKETFQVRLTDITSGRLIATAVGTILDDDAVPQVTIDDAEVEEGNSGFSTLTFPVHLSGPSALPVTVGFASSDETAEAGVDYVPINDTLIFRPGITEGFIRVQVFSDLLDEDDETFLVTLTVSDGSAALPSDPTQARGTIRDDDLPPRLLVSDAVVPEGDQGSFKMAFGVRLSAPSGRPVVFGFETVDGTAVAGEDYDSVAGVEVFPAGQIRPFVVTVVVHSDRTPEPDETFRVRLSNVLNSERVEANGTIINDDFLPTLRIADGSATEGGPQSTNAVVFQVELSSPSTVPVSVSYVTSDGTARAGDDFEPVTEARILELAPGKVSGRILVPVRGDSVQELSEEIFFLNLLNPVNATLVDLVAIGTIADDDAPLGISISDATVTEGDTGTTHLVFEVRLSGAVEHPVRVDYEIFGNTVTVGQLQFQRGQVLQTIRVAVAGDLIDENDEVILVQLRNAVGASIQDRTGVGTIVDDDPAPTMQIGNLSVEEGAVLKLNVRLSTPSRKRVTVQYTTANGSALSGDDYTTATGGLIFDPGVTEQTILIATVEDSISESTETFSVLFSAPVNAVLPVSSVQLEIVDNDPMPGLSISNATVRETDTGFTSALFIVRLSAVSAGPVSVRYATAGLLATADVDFKSASGTLEFPPGITEGSFAVEVIGDLVAEVTETFTVTLSRATGAMIIGGVGTGTILDNDIVPLVSVADASVLEGNGGSSAMVFTVRLSEPSNRAVTLNYRTAAGTATAGADFVPATGTISIAAGVLTNSVSVSVVGDLLDEANETFELVLSAPVNARISDGRALGTIVDDDTNFNQAPTIRIVNPLNASAVHSPADVIIEVEAADSDGELRSVEFYVGSVLLETRTAPPYRILWENDASGEYSLTAVATDDEGARTVSEPVILLAKRGVIVSEVAIVRNAPNPEIRKIQEVLLDLGLSSQVFDQGGLRFESISDYQLIIWNDTGVEGLTANDVGVFREALDNQIPLYLIGESLAVSGKGLTGAARTDWARLTHLALGLAGSSVGSITVDSPSGHPVVNGHFGVVGDIAYAPGFDSVVQDGFGVSLLASSGSSDLLIAAEADNFDATRSVTQGFLVSRGEETRSLSERRRLFKNAVLWLMRKSFHALTDLSLTVAPPVDSIRSGVEFVYSATIGHRGEISGTGIALTLEIPPSVRFIRGDYLQGRVEVVDGDVIYHPGSLENGQQSTVDLVFVVVQPGPFTLKGSVFGNEADPVLGNNVDVQQWTALQGASEAPRLMLSRVGGDGINLQMSNDSLLSVTLQESTDLVRWQNVTNTTDRLLLLPVGATADPSGVRKFYRVVQP